jgi:hypothetical protein
VASPGLTVEGSFLRNSRRARWSMGPVSGDVFKVTRTTISARRALCAASTHLPAHPIRVMSTLTSRATMTVLNAKEMTLLPVTTRRILLVVTSTSELEKVVPI